MEQRVFFCFDFAVCQMFCKESYTVGQASEFASNFRQHFRRLEHQEWLACGCSNDPYVGDAQRQVAQLWQTAQCRFFSWNPHEECQLVCFPKAASVECRLSRCRFRQGFGPVPRVLARVGWWLCWTKLQ